MKLMITMKQGPKSKIRSIVTKLSDDQTSLESLRQIWEIERRLNELPGSDIRWHFNVVED